MQGALCMLTYCHITCSAAHHIPDLCQRTIWLLLPFGVTPAVGGMHSMHGMHKLLASAQRRWLQPGPGDAYVHDM